MDTFMVDTGEANEFAQEQFLAADLGTKAEPPESGIDLVRPRQLSAPVLHTGVIDHSWPAARRIDASLAFDAHYVAVTDRGRYVGMLSRDAVQNSILEALVARLGQEHVPDGR